MGESSSRYSIQVGENMVTVHSDAEVEREIGADVTLEFSSQSALAIAAWACLALAGCDLVPTGEISKAL
jgi:hypothetical protein